MFELLIPFRIFFVIGKKFLKFLAYFLLFQSCGVGLFARDDFWIVSVALHCGTLVWPSIIDLLLPLPFKLDSITWNHLNVF